MRKLAHIERIHTISPIANADKIELVSVLGWNVVAKKDEFNVGDLCIYVEIDSRVPSDDKRFEFLEPRKFKIKSTKMRGVLSQGIVFHLKDFPELGDVKEGDDVTNKLRITKIITDEEKRLALEEAKPKTKFAKFTKTKLGKWLMKFKFTRNLLVSLFVPKNNKLEFPKWIVKTDEERIQNLPYLCDGKTRFVATEKIDGTSTTFGLRATNKKRTKYEFIVCSRNVRQASIKQKNYHTETNGANVYWEMALKYDVENVLRKIAKEHKLDSIYLQGETIGPKIQGNPYKLEANDFYAFNLAINGIRVDMFDATLNFLKDSGIKWVPMVVQNYKIPKTVIEVLYFAEGFSMINPKVKREGLVFRNNENPIVSFKAVSNSYLLKRGD